MPIRNTVIFRHPAAFVSATEAEGILSTESAEWFVDLLRRIPRLRIDPKLCQEDWGVVVFGQRDGFRFWFGLSFSAEGEWLAHVHHRGLLQRLRATGMTGYEAVISDLHRVLAADDAVDDARWYIEDEMNLPDPRGAPSPDG